MYCVLVVILRQMLVILSKYGAWIHFLHLTVFYDFGEPKNMYIFRYFLFSCCLSLAYCNMIQKTVLDTKEQTAKNLKHYLKYFKTLNISFTSSSLFSKEEEKEEQMFEKQ